MQDDSFVSVFPFIFSRIFNTLCIFLFRTQVTILYDMVMKNGGAVDWIDVQRLICGEIHRQLPTNLKPFKHYNADIIDGVLAGVITSEDVTYEDYPCERSHKLQVL